MSRRAALPIRVRLTAWYTAVLALVLLGMAALSYSLLARLVAVQAEEALAETASTFFVSLRALGSAAPPAVRAQVVRAAVDRFRYPDRRLLFYDGSTPMAASSVPEGAEQRGPFLIRPDAPTLLATLQRGARVTILPPPAPGLSPVRIYIRRPRFGGGRFAVAVLGSTRPEEAFLAAVRSYFVIFIPLALLLAAAVGYFLATRSLAPVSAMTRQAERIGAANLEERLPVANPGDELGRLAAVLNSLLSRLHDAFEQQRRFMADAAHELRTPVAVIRGEAEVALARSARPEGEYRDTLEVVAGESVRLSGIVDDLFTLARADAGQVPLRPTPLYLEELVAETARAIATLAARKRIELTVAAPAELPFTGDEALLRRMLTNLLDNAVKYTSPGGQVRVSAGRTDGRYRIAVSDTGPGIPPEHRERIFERFHRVEGGHPDDEAASSASAGSAGDATDRGGGAGLGLPIARWIAQAHHGTLTLAETGPAGSRFVVELPAAPTDVHLTESTPAQRRPR